MELEHEPTVNDRRIIPGELPHPINRLGTEDDDAAKLRLIERGSGHDQLAGLPEAAKVGEVLALDGVR